MRRELLATGLAVSALALAAPSAGGATIVGIGEQQPAALLDPLFLDLRLERARVVAPWNVAYVRYDRRILDAWLLAADEAGVEPLVSFGAATGSRCPARPCTLPSVRRFARAFAAFQRRWPDVYVVNPWNEANHRSQPTFRNPRRAAEFYNVVRERCFDCSIVAADVIDETNMVRWLRTFRRYAKRPRIWGLHNYRDTNPRPGQLLGGTRRLLRAVRGEVWLTETGGLVKFVLPEGATLFSFSESRADRATQRMFRLARRYRRRITRLYVYHWQAPSPTSRFDAGLVRPDGTPRPAYFTVKRQLGTRFFGP
jgi:hypothetical protein